MKFSYLLVTSLAFGSILFLPGAAHAAANERSDDIVVTAQKREQPAQDVPISLVAVSSATIERQGITSVQDLGNTIAGVTIAAGNPGAMRLTIRGATDLSSSNQSAPVNGYYLDETVMSYVPGFMPEVSLFDIERVEVLRGPQGTLFGEGSEGGTLRVITRKPDSTRAFGRGKLGVYATEGGGQGFGAQLNANIPLVRDVLAVSLAGGYRDLPGWIDIPDIAVKDSNTSKLADGRIALRYTPTSKLTIDMFYQIGRGKIRDFISTSRYELNPRAVASQFGVGPVGGLSPSQANLDVGALTVSYDTGPATLVAASSLTTTRYDTTRDLTTIVPAVFPPDLVPRAVAQSIYRVYSRAFTQEIRLVSNNSDKLKWTIGGYFKHEHRTVEEGYVFNVPAIPYVDQPLSQSDQNGNAWAVFGDVDYALTDRLSVQAGLRYFKDDKTFNLTQVRGSVFPLGFPAAGTMQAGKDSSAAASPKFGLTYKISPKVLVFAKVSRGFRSGGSNTAPSSIYPYVNSQYGPDSLYAYELGLKSQPFAGWTVNLYLYHNDWKDLQLPFRTDDGRFSYVGNAGKAKVDGLELEVAADVTRSLNLDLAYAYNNAAIDGDVKDRLGNVIVKSGSELPLNSQHKVTVIAHYERQLGSSLGLDLDARYRWASEFFSDPGHTPGYTNQPTSQLFLSASLKGKWGVLTLFADNVLNRDDTVAKYPPAGPPLYIYTNYLRPRNFGLELKRDF